MDRTEGGRFLWKVFHFRTMVADDEQKTGGRQNHPNIHPRKDPIKNVWRSKIDGKPPGCRTWVEPFKNA
jgi:hypothetical protein